MSETTPPKKKSKNYIENEDLKRALAESHANNSQPTNELLAMFKLHIERQMREFTYKNPDDRYDAYSAAMYIVLKKWRECDLNRERPFAWFTRVIYNAIYAYWRRAHKNSSVTISISGIFEENI